MVFLFDSKSKVITWTFLETVAVHTKRIMNQIFLIAANIGHWTKVSVITLLGWTIIKFVPQNTSNLFTFLFSKTEHIRTQHVASVKLIITDAGK